MSLNEQGITNLLDGEQMSNKVGVELETVMDTTTTCHVMSYLPVEISKCRHDFRWKWWGFYKETSKNNYQAFETLWFAQIHIENQVIFFAGWFRKQMV